MDQQPYQRATLTPTLRILFLSFLRLGTTAFGGPAMVAYIRRMAVEQNRWVDDESFRDGVALCQTIPGATAMQTSAYVGLRARGVAGAAVSFIGFGLPAFCFMLVLSALYAPAHALAPVSSAFDGLRAIIVAIVANATISFGKTTLRSWRDLVPASAAAGLFGLGVNPILVILLAALLGLAIPRGQPLMRKATPSSAYASSTRALAILLFATAFGYLLLFLANRSLFDLGALMFRIDLFAFGGGFASVPLMLHEVVDVRAWMDGPTFMNGIALGQVTPGPIVITATFVGYWLYGLAGALIATLSVFLPSFLIVIGVVPYYDRLRESVYFNRALGGVLASFVGLLLSVTLRFAMNVTWDPGHALLAGATLVALLFQVDILWVVLVGIGISVLASKPP